MTDDGVHGFVYDRSERAVSVSGGASGSFVYDAHGRRVKQVLDGETIYTVYGIEGTLYLRENATTGESTDYVRMGDFVVGRVDETDTFERIFADRLGGPVIGATRQSSVLWRESYTPFGELLDDPPANRDEALLRLQSIPRIDGSLRDRLEAPAISATTPPASPTPRPGITTR